MLLELKLVMGVLVEIMLIMFLPPTVRIKTPRFDIVERQLFKFLPPTVRIKTQK